MIGRLAVTSNKALFCSHISQIAPRVSSSEEELLITLMFLCLRIIVGPLNSGVRIHYYNSILECYWGYTGLMEKKMETTIIVELIL